MRNTATAGQILGWAAIFLGAMAVLIAAFSGYEDTPWNLRADVRMARVAQGLSAIAAGIMFLLLSGILTTLLDLREDAQAERRTMRCRDIEPQQIAAGPPSNVEQPAPQPTERPEEIVIPSRFSMMAEYGREIGAEAWEVMAQAKMRGLRMTVENGVAEAKRRLSGHG